MAKDDQATKDTVAKTTYVVLRAVEAGGDRREGDSIPLPAEGEGQAGAVYVLLDDTHTVGNADQATKAAAEKNGAGRYVAVPSRSFSEHQYDVENQPRIVRVRK